jgi:hypothetical protein
MSMTEFALMTLIFQRGVEIWYFSKCLQWSIKKIEFFRKYCIFLSQIEKEMDKQYEYSLVIYGLSQQRQRFIRYYTAIIENNKKDNQEEGE